MLETYDYDQLRGLSGHEVVSEDGEKVGYIDLVFRDNETGVPEWLGIWDGLPNSRPRVLVPVRDVRVEGGAVRVPWPAARIREAPSYEGPHDTFIGHDTVVEIGPETEHAAHEHYGIERAPERADRAEGARFRVWRVQSF